MCLIYSCSCLFLAIHLSRIAAMEVNIEEELPPSGAGGIPEEDEDWLLKVMLVRVGSDSVWLEWSCFPPAVRQQLVTCQARYGLLTPDKTILQQFHHHHQPEEETGSWWRFQQTQVDVLDHFLPESNSFRLTNLTTNTSYVFAMICILWGAAAGQDHHHGKSVAGHNIHYVTINSNPIFFTTRTAENVVDSIKDRRAGYPLRYRSHEQYHQQQQQQSHDWNDHMDPIRWTWKLSSQRPSTTTLSYNIILGIVCGLIGFLIINVTIVMALRKYSRWRTRQTRIRHLRFIYGDSADNYYDVT